MLSTRTHGGLTVIKHIEIGLSGKEKRDSDDK